MAIEVGRGDRLGFRRKLLLAKRAHRHPGRLGDVLDPNGAVHALDDQLNRRPAQRNPRRLLLAFPKSHASAPVYASNLQSRVNCTTLGIRHLCNLVADTVSNGYSAPGDSREGHPRTVECADIGGAWDQVGQRCYDYLLKTDV
jgi:hypothetical protein